MEVLEALEYHRKTFAPLSWGWLFEMEIPWLALVILLTYDQSTTPHTDIVRSRHLLQLNFDRFSADPVATTPMWNLLVRLRERAHLQWNQAGASETPTISASLENQVDSLLYDDQWMLDQQNLYDLIPNDEQMTQEDVQDMPWL